MIRGYVAEGYEDVRDEFRANFERRREIGAAVAAYVDGEKVVDLWGGWANPRRRVRWEEDTMVLVYSTSKGLASMTLALAHSRGWLDYDELVATYWPEFAQNGKSGVTVRQLLGHEAGLPVIDEPLDLDKLRDFDVLAEILARQKPAWPPGTRHGYHGLSLGWYEGELLRRVDPQHRTLGRFFAEEIAAKLGLEIYFGLPEEVDHRRVARIQRARSPRELVELRNLPPPMLRAFANPRSLTARAFMNPRVWSPADLDRRDYRTVESPASSAIGKVRDIARAYSALATGGKEMGVSAATLEELSRPASPPTRGWHDEVLRVDTAFSLGYVKPSTLFRFGSSERAFGHPGAGGSFAFADPDRRVSFAYAMNRMGMHLNNDPREQALREALYRCLRRLSRADRAAAAQPDAA
jgi:CubicO group peptidase (beta-lactamase class C family)